MRRRGAFSDRNPVLLGYVGTVVVLAVVLAVVNIDRIPVFGGGTDYRAAFAEAGGISSGDAVVFKGLTIGEVTAVRLEGSHVSVGFRVSDRSVHLGDRTRASISTLTMLGRKALDVESAGTKPLRPGAEIPMSRTTSPYDVTDALSQLTSQAGAIDVASLSQALTSISDTFRRTPDQLSSAMKGLGRVADTLASRDDILRELLEHTDSLSGVLSERNHQITSLMTDGATLLAELNRRRDSIVALLQNATAVGVQLRGLAADQKARLRPALDEFQRVLRVLNENKVNIETALERLSNYATSLGESVGSGPFFDAYLANLTSPAELPFFPSSLLPPQPTGRQP